MYERRPQWLLLALGLCVSAPVLAEGEVYKWVDEKGVVNYGSEPPKRGKAQLLAPESARLSVVPGRSTGAAAQPEDRERVLQQRVARLENELEEQRRSRLLAAQSADEAEAARRQSLRERCELERRVDCDGYPLVAPYDTVVVVAPPHRHFHHPLKPVISPLQRSKPAPRPLLEGKNASPGMRDR